MANPVLILLIVFLIVFIVFQMLGKHRGKSVSQKATKSTVIRPSATLMPFQGRPGVDNIMADLKQELESLKSVLENRPAGDEPQGHVLRSLMLITAKLADLEQRVRKFERQAAREEKMRQMYEKP